MTYPRAIVVAAALIAGALVWQTQAQGQSEAAREVKAVVSGELIWWLETTPTGPQVSVCEFDGRQVNCQSQSLGR